MTGLGLIYSIYWKSKGLTNWVDIERELALVASLSDKKSRLKHWQYLKAHISSYKRLCVSISNPYLFRVKRRFGGF